MSRVRTSMVLTLLASACAAEPASPPAPERQRIGAEELPPIPDEHPDVRGLDVLSRGPRRMSIEQLERSIERIGALPTGSVEIPATLAAALGEPDYLRVTDESLEPSPLFMKFMVDLGGFVCQGLLDYEPQRPAAERVFTRYTSVEENVRHVLFRFTSIEGTRADPYVDRLLEVYERASLGETGAGCVRRGFEAVCLAVFTSPEFLLY